MRMYSYVRMCRTPASTATTTGSGKKSIIAKLRVYSRTHNMESRDRTSRGENRERWTSARCHATFKRCVANAGEICLLFSFQCHFVVLCIVNSLGPIAHICAHLFRTFGVHSAYMCALKLTFLPVVIRQRRLGILVVQRYTKAARTSSRHSTGFSLT